MKIFKLNKNTLKWKEINQIQYKWKLPILVNHKREVIAGNSLYDSLPDEILVCVIEKNQKLEDNLFYIEEKVVEEGKIERVGILDSELRNYFKELRKPETQQLTLFDNVKETGLISEENYILRKDKFKSHGYKNILEDYQLYLFESEEDEIKSSRYDDIEIDMEILKELL